MRIYGAVITVSFIYLFFAELEINCIQGISFEGTSFLWFDVSFQSWCSWFTAYGKSFICLYKMKLWECFLESIVKEKVHAHDCIGVSSSTATCSLMGYPDQKYKHWWRKQLWPLVNGVIQPPFWTVAEFIQHKPLSMNPTFHWRKPTFMGTGPYWDMLRAIFSSFQPTILKANITKIPKAAGKVFESDATFRHEMKRPHNAAMKARCCASDRRWGICAEEPWNVSSINQGGDGGKIKGSGHKLSRSRPKCHIWKCFSTR